MTTRWPPAGNEGPHHGVFVADDEREASEFLMGKWQEICQEAIGERGVFVVALSGGRTPVAFYRRLADLGNQLPWTKTHIFLVDERFVPVSHEDSNYGMLRRTLLDKVNIPPGNCHPVPAEAPSPEAAAREYDEELRRFFNRAGTGEPVFDLILLGLGEDGHTASLFPGEDFSSDSGGLARATILEGNRHSRVTLPLAVLNKARNVVFLVTGRSKAGVLRRVVDEGDPVLPASRVRPEKGSLLFLADTDAASYLPGREPRGEWR